MLTLKEEFSNEIEIKRSRFICHMTYVNDEQEAKDYIQKINEQHKSATHNCTVYKIGAIVRIDDDGEPKQTAALPMLEVLNHHDFNNICVVVTRYFGGTKLGAGGLIRAYAKAVSEAIKIAPVESLVPGKKVLIRAGYQDTRAIEYYLANEQLKIITKEYIADVRYHLLVEDEQYEKLVIKLNQLNHLIQIEIQEETLIAKQT